MKFLVARVQVLPGSFHHSFFLSITSYSQEKGILLVNSMS